MNLKWPLWSWEELSSTLLWSLAVIRARFFFVFLGGGGTLVMREIFSVCLPAVCEPCCTQCSLCWSASLPVSQRLWVHNSFVAEAEAAIWRRAAAAATAVCVGSIQGGKQLRMQPPDKHSGLMTCTGLRAAGSRGDRWGFRPILCFKWAARECAYVDVNLKTESAAPWWAQL